MQHTRSSAVGLAAVLAVAAAIPLLAQSAAENAADADRLVATLHVQTGSTVCEVGAGAGELTVLLAKAVGPTGRIYSNELSADRRREIERAAVTGGVTNVTIVEGQADDANLPAAACDALFMRDVYHHFANPAAMNPTLLRALKPGGRIAILDFAAGNGESPDPAGRAKEPHHGVSSATVMRELAAAGFGDLSSEPLRGKFMFIVVGVKPEP
jgi:ubiquinone/menaquinone biosynthesis C-methylase UbiE